MKRSSLSRLLRPNPGAERSAAGPPLRWMLPAVIALTLLAVANVEVAGDETAEDAVLERGRYLVTIAGCGDCHTPMKMGAQGPEPDMGRYLSGHPEDLVLTPPPTGGVDDPWIWHGTATNTAFAGPWGVSYAINLTPDEVTGLGPWTEEIFVKAIRSGRHWGASRPILPPMPWPAYSQMSDHDLAAVFAFLRSVPAVHNQAPDAQVAELEAELSED